MFENPKYLCIVIFLYRKVLLKKNKRDKIEREKLSALENMCKEKAFNTTLYSYLSLCVSKHIKISILVCLNKTHVGDLRRQGLS